MSANIMQSLFFLEVLILASVIFMHLSKKSASIISLYQGQSLLIALLLFVSAFWEKSFFMLIVAIVTFLVKVIIAPRFFKKLVLKNHIQFSASSYLNAPQTLLALAVLVGFAHSRLFLPLDVIAPHNIDTMLLALATMFISIFLLINRKGALSQVFGILSLENAIVSFAFFSGLEQSPALQLGILFDVFVWVIIATAFTSMIYQKMKTLDVTLMQKLKEE